MPRQKAVEELGNIVLLTQSAEIPCKFHKDTSYMQDSCRLIYFYIFLCIIEKVSLNL